MTGVAILSLLFSFLGSISAAAQSTFPRSLAASHVSSDISIDARLDEDAWHLAEVATDFVQFEPTKGGAASQQTEVRDLYGSANLYVGAIHHDDQPSRIENALGRRDDINRANWFFVSIDSYFDRRTAYVFKLNYTFLY